MSENPYYCVICGAKLRTIFPADEERECPYCDIAYEVCHEEFGGTGELRQIKATGKPQHPDMRSIDERYP